MFHKDKTHSIISLSELRKKHQAERISRILTTGQLQSEDKRAAQLQTLLPLTGLSEENYALYCQRLLDEYCLYLQDLPETRNSYFSTKGGFISHGLSRCEASLKACRAYFVNDEGNPAKELSEDQQQWMYCLFSASFLRGIGKLLADLLVDMFDGAGTHLGRWNPLQGPMNRLGATFYDYDFDVPQHGTFRRRVTIALATKIMPAKGLAWLSSNKKVYEIWLALLDDDMRAAGTLGIIMDKADAFAINRFFQERAIAAYQAGGDPTKLISSQFNAGDDGEPAQKVGDIPQEGVEFIKWLAKALGSAQLMVNKSPLLSVPGGLLMSPDLFKLFIKENPQFKSWQAVQKAFSAMGLHSLGADGQALQTFKDGKSNSSHSGVVLSAVGVVLPETFKAVDLTSGATKSVARADFAAISHSSGHMVSQSNTGANVAQALSKSGQWITPGSALQASMSNKQ